MNPNFLFPLDISHTRGPLDGSLYAQVRKRRGPGPTSSPNGCLASSPTVTTQIAKQSQILTGTSSCVPSDHIENRSSFTAHPGNEKPESLTDKGQTETKENVRGKEKDRETEILDDAKLSNPGGLARECGGRAGATCGGVGRQWEQEPCLADGHCAGCCNSLRKHPKSQTLPALPSKSVSPPPHLTHMELCHRHSVHPLPELAWEQPTPSVPCLHRPCFPYSASEYPHSHGHTLPASNRHYNDESGSTDTKPPSPVPDGYHTPTFPLAPYYYPLLNVPHVPYTGYTAITIPASQPPLPEKKRLSSTPGSLNGHVSHLRGSPVPSPTHNVTLPATMTEQRQGYAQFSSSREDIRVNAKFVQDSSKYWYKPSISRDQAIAVLKDKEPGTFLIRDSNSFQGAYGLALKVATPPPNANITADAVEQLVRHFLIETGPRGVKIKGCQNEAYFGSLSALVYQHSITPISLPCALRIPERGKIYILRSVTNTSTAADLLKQGAACNVLYLNSVDTESLTGPEAVSKASKSTLALSPRPAATVVHFKVSSQGITLTDSKRRLFFRRHYPISSVTFSSLDPQDQR
uniref:SH2 domain-containing protein n=1 Tax=Hippocampus comes TaxID=109280 RepID=A0A3Q2XV96_HIPCM